VHCDIKPGNIMLQAEHAMVTDFGIARAMTAAGGAELTETGVILGTPSYMSPEQTTGGRDVDERSDVYSLGCVLYEMLEGRPPFAGATADAILEQHRSASPPAVTAPAGPGAVGGAIRRALAKRPADRFADAGDFAAALPVPEAAATPRLGSGRRPWGSRVVVAGIAVAAAVAGWAGLSRRHSPAVHPAASVIAVLPVVPTTPDSALTGLGRDLVVTLSANLDGVGQIRTVDAQTVLAQTRRPGPLALADGAELARRLGASSVVHGTIVAAGPAVRVDVSLFTADGGTTVARASVTADPGDLTTITDSLTWALLREIWRSRAPPTPSLAGVTTRSLPALRAFLEGERAGLEGRWNDATEAYGRAMRADSTFWLAVWRYSYARWWYLDAVEDSILDPLFAHRFSLPERDRLVLESWWTDTISVALARAREAVEKYPDYWPAWMQYGDWLFHVGPPHGYDRTAAEAALERTVALNPTLAPAWEHLLWSAIPHDVGVAGRALEALVRLDAGRASSAEFGFDITRVYRLEVGFTRSGTLDGALLDSIADDLVHRARGRAGGGTSLLPAQVELSRRVLRAGPRPDLAATHERLLAEALAGRGAWDSALVVAEKYARRPIGADPLAAYRLAVVGAWAGAVAPDSAARQRALPAFAVARPGGTAMERAELGWLDGLLAMTRGDRDALAAARGPIRDANATTGDLLARALAAFEMALEGNRGRAARVLAELNWERPDLLTPGYTTHPYVIAVHRLAAAQWLLAEGDTLGASRLLMWFDAAWALDGYRPARRVLGGLAAWELARIAEMREDPDLARRRYAEFLRHYDMPVPTHGHLVDDARAALMKLNPQL
jgi:TolB-like protein